MNSMLLLGPPLVRRPEANRTPVSRGTPPTGGSRFTSLDGIRALAVTTVVLLHLSLTGWVGGGQAGVTVFFVLSGFLITKGMLSEYVGSGRVNLRTFHSKRLWRLGPAFVLIALLGLIGSLTQIPAMWGGRPATPEFFAQTLTSSVGQWLNFDFAAHQIRAYELLPTWSLNIEEQFYIGWSLIVVLLLWRGASIRLIGWVAGIGAIASFTWCWYLAVDPANLHRVAYATDTQLGAVLIGCALAVLLRRTWVRDNLQRYGRPLGLLAATVIAMFLVNAPLNFPLYTWGQGTLAIATAFGIAVLVNGQPGIGSRVLSFAPLVWIGERSYGIYLFHTTMLVWAGGPGDWQRSVIVVGSTVILAAASYRFIEQPLLRWSNQRRSRAPRMTAPRMQHLPD